MDLLGLAVAVELVAGPLRSVAKSLDVFSFVIGAPVNHRQPGVSVDCAGYVAYDIDRVRAPLQIIYWLSAAPARANRFVDPNDRSFSRRSRRGYLFRTLLARAAPLK